MCGILTYYSKNGITKDNINECLLSLNTIKHRGPDGEGIVLINSITGENKTILTKDTPKDINCDFNEFTAIEDHHYDLLLGHRRLSIFDTSSAGHQPMKDQFGNCIIFNGEIYNFHEIKQDLESKGYSFKSRTDTEVILASYQEWGKECLSRFNGMWSFVLWDNQKKFLFISNDRFGVKPLYHYQTENSIMFFSEIKQIKAFKEFDNILNKDNCNLYLNYKQICFDETTFYENVIRFSPGYYEIYDFKSKRLFQQYYSIEKIKKCKKLFKEAEEEFKFIFHNAVDIRMRSDVKWGVGLSGGLDSSSVLFYVNKVLEERKDLFRPITFSAVFPGMEGDESTFINDIINKIQVKSYTVNPYEQFSVEDFNKHLYYQEIPPISTSFYAQWKVAELVNKSGVTVNLVGQGADEIFGGYHAHFYKYCRSLILKGNVLRYLNEVKGYSRIKNLSISYIHKIVIGDLFLAFKFRLGLSKLDNKLLKYWNQINDLTCFMKAEFTTFQLPYYLLSDDRTSMAHRVETRHPFLDYRIVEFAYSLPESHYIKNGWSKYIVRKSMNDLPENIRWRRDKKGFTTPQSKIINKLIPESIDLETDFRKYCLNQLIKNN